MDVAHDPTDDRPTLAQLKAVVERLRAEGVLAVDGRVALREYRHTFSTRRE